MSQALFLGYSGVTYDTDAQAYFDAIEAEISMSSTQKTDINNFIIGAKSDGFYTNLDALYFPVWEDADANKYNIIDPRDLDAAFRLSYNGTITHNSNGISTADGATHYSNTHYIVGTSGNLTNTSAMLAAYVQTTETGSRTYLGTSQNQTPDNNYLLGVYSSGTLNMGAIGGLSGEYAPSSSSSEVLGMVMVTTNGDRNAQHWTNGTKNGSTVAQTGSTFPVNPIIIGAANTDTTPWITSGQIFSMLAIGSGFTDQQAADFYTRVQTLHTAFGIAQ